MSGKRRVYPPFRGKVIFFPGGNEEDLDKLLYEAYRKLWDPGRPDQNLLNDIKELRSFKTREGDDVCSDL